MQLLNVTNTPVKLSPSPFYQGSQAVLSGAAGLILQGGVDAAGTGGWTNIGVALVANQMQLVTLTHGFLRCSTAATVQLLNN